MNQQQRRHDDPEENVPEIKEPEHQKPPPPMRPGGEDEAKRRHATAVIGIIIGVAAGVSGQLNSVMFFIFIGAIAVFIWAAVTQRNERATAKDRVRAAEYSKLALIAVISSNGSYLLASFARPYFQ